MVHELLDSDKVLISQKIKSSLPHIRSTSGRIILTSSGAATGAYSTWGAYGSSKAAINHLALTLEAEEPLVTALAIRPGVVDTDVCSLSPSDRLLLMLYTDAKSYQGRARPCYG